MLSHSTCAEFLLKTPYILEFSQLVSCSHFCLQELQHLLTCMSLFIVTHYALRFIVRNSSIDLHCWFHNMVTLPSVPVYTNFCIWPYNCLLYNFLPISLHMLQCSSAHTVSCLCMYCSFANIGHADMICSTVSSIYICSLFLFVIFLLHNIWFAMPDPVLPLFHFQSLLSDLPSTAIATHLLH